MTEAEFRERIKEILYRHGMYSPTEAQYWQEKLLEEFDNLFTEAMKDKCSNNCNLTRSVNEALNSGDGSYRP